MPSVSVSVSVNCEVAVTYYKLHSLVHTSLRHGTVDACFMGGRYLNTHYYTQFYLPHVNGNERSSDPTTVKEA